MNENSALIKPNPVLELGRKVAQRLHCCHDVISLDHTAVIKKQKELGVHRFPGGKKNGEEPVFLLRVDDLPSPHGELKDFLRFHELLKKYQLPYLLAVTPFWQGRAAFTNEEADVLKRITREGVELALHGFTHQKISLNIASELLGLSEGSLKLKIKSAVEYLSTLGCDPKVFVAPYNSYDPATIPVLSKCFSVLCGGPESVRSFGYRIPSFFQGSFYLPSYRYAYDLRDNQMKTFDRLIQAASGLVIPITMHWANEVKDGFKTLEKIIFRVKGRVISWNEFLQSVDAMKSAKNDE